MRVHHFKPQQSLRVQWQQQGLALQAAAAVRLLSQRNGESNGEHTSNHRPLHLLVVRGIRFCYMESILEVIAVNS